MTGDRVPEASVVPAGKIECNACPVLCQIAEGRSGACDRYANVAGELTRVDPVLLMTRGRVPAQASAPVSAGASATLQAGGVATLQAGGSASMPSTPSSDADALAVASDDAMVAFAGDWDGDLIGRPVFVTGVGAGTTYPDYKPAPFIVSSRQADVDMITVVTEGIFSYCSYRIKLDTDRYLGPECATVRHRGEAVGHVTTIEYGSQFLSVGGVHHLTGGSKKEGRVTCDLMMALGNREAVDFEIESGATLRVQAGRPPVVDGVEEQRMRVGCGSATIGIFARQWRDHVDEVVVVDDHITGVLTEHQAGKCLDMPPSGIRIRGRKSTPGRYFQVAHPGTGWGGTDVSDPLTIIESWNPKIARAGLRLLMVSTTGDHSAYFVLDDALQPLPAPMPPEVRGVVERIGENCEPSLATVLFVAGAGGSLRAGVTENPVLLTRSIKDLLTRVTVGGAPAYVWPGGGITVMVDVTRMPERSFGWVPTPAIVAPIEFTMRLDDYRALGGHMDRVLSIEQALARSRLRWAPWQESNPWPAVPDAVAAAAGVEARSQ